ncbi:MAG: hypothetical protein LBH34_01170 [Prevotellaceae bacterium]|jgi:hypothetical protein|nr:hypothetical protein [Prevotellaceae bacterium]
MRRYVGIFLLLLVTANHTSAQTSDSTTAIDYKPSFDGRLKVRFLVDSYDGKNNFEVKNARFNMRGKLSKDLSYRMQVEYSNAGKFNVLDLNATYNLKSFRIRFGQQLHGFSTEMGLAPVDDKFSNRSFMTNFITSYTEVDGNGILQIKSIGARDVGALFTYYLQTVPAYIQAGVFNGSGLNSPTWKNNVNVAVRLEIGQNQGLKGALSYYGGKAPSSQEIQMWNAELRYITKTFRVEGELAQRYLSDSITHRLSTVFVQTYYKLELNPQKRIKYIMPTLRWDMGENVNLYNAAENIINFLNINRVTVGVNFGLISSPKFLAEARLNYEKFFVSHKPSNFGSNRFLHDMFMVELAFAF